MARLPQQLLPSTFLALVRSGTPGLGRRRRTFQRSMLGGAWWMRSMPRSVWSRPNDEKLGKTVLVLLSRRRAVRKLAGARVAPPHHPSVRGLPSARGRRPMHVLAVPLPVVPRRVAAHSLRLARHYLRVRLTLSLPCGRGWRPRECFASEARSRGFVLQSVAFSLNNYLFLKFPAK